MIRKAMLLTIAAVLLGTLAAPALADGFSFGFSYDRAPRYYSGGFSYNSAPRYYTVPRTVYYSEPTVAYRSYPEVVYYDAPRVRYFTNYAPAPTVVYRSYAPVVRSSRTYFRSCAPTFRTYRSYPAYSHRYYDRPSSHVRVRVR